MLYLLRSDGTIDELPEATSAVLDEDVGVLICYDDEGREVARYPRLDVVMFRRTPFPTGEVEGGGPGGHDNG